MWLFIFICWQSIKLCFPVCSCLLRPLHHPVRIIAQLSHSRFDEVPFKSDASSPSVKELLFPEQQINITTTFALVWEWMWRFFVFLAHINNLNKRKQYSQCMIDSSPYLLTLGNWVCTAAEPWITKPSTEMCVFRIEEENKNVLYWSSLGKFKCSRSKVTGRWSMHIHRKVKNTKLEKYIFSGLWKKEGRNFMSEKEVVWRHGSEKRWQSWRR